HPAGRSNRRRRVDIAARRSVPFGGRSTEMKTTTGLPAPGSKEDMMLAARLVVENVIPEATMRAVLAKQNELKERGHALSTAEICRRKGWITESEARLLANPERPPRDLLPGLDVGQFLGQGGMSRVFQATDISSGASVAVKILHPNLRRDAQMLA